MALKRIGTSRRAKRAAVVIGTERGVISIPHSRMRALNTEGKLITAIRAAAAANKMQLPPIFVHLNRDGSVCLAVGAAPDTWPEDENREPIKGGELL